MTKVSNNQHFNQFYKNGYSPIPARIDFLACFEPIKMASTQNLQYLLRFEYMSNCIFESCQEEVKCIPSLLVSNEISSL